MHDLRTFLYGLGSKLLHIDDEVDPINQAGIISSEAGGPIILDNLKGFPAGGSPTSWSRTGSLRPSRSGRLQIMSCSSWPRSSSRSDRGRSARSRTGPCKEVKLLGSDIDVRSLPIPVHSVGDGAGVGGRYLGSGVTITKGSWHRSPQ
jgi:3-polyprenyl-4-hydroxybenzoate decarboxylase